jgi:hypothetical protein
LKGFENLQRRSKMLKKAMLSLAITVGVLAMEFPEAALALNPQPEVPSMPKPDPEPHPDPARTPALDRKGASPFSVPANWVRRGIDNRNLGPR